MGTRIGSTVRIHQLETLALVFAMAQEQVRLKGAWSVGILQAAHPELSRRAIREYLQTGEREQCLTRLEAQYRLERQRAAGVVRAGVMTGTWEKRRRGEAPLPKGFLRTPEGNIIRERRAGERGGIMSPSGTQAQEAAE